MVLVEQVDQKSADTDVVETRTPAVRGGGGGDSLREEEGLQQRSPAVSSRTAFWDQSWFWLRDQLGPSVPLRKNQACSLPPVLAVAGSHASEPEPVCPRAAGPRREAVSSSAFVLKDLTESTRRS